MVKMGDPVGTLGNAQALAALGLQVFPAKHADKDKAPVVKWREYRHTRVTDLNLAQWFTGTRARNYWVLCGALSGVVVLDTDNAAAEAWWREFLGDEILDSTAAVKTSKGYHYWFKIPESYDGPPIKSWAKHPESGADDPAALSFDFRGEGGGVLAPPSVHETGLVYSWIRPFSAIQEAPPALLDGGAREAAPGVERGQRAPAGGGASAVARIGPGGRVNSTLSELLLNPPAEGGRNAWLTNVAGHYATEYRYAPDLYEAHCKLANATCSPPLDDDEFEKTIASIWGTEQGKPVQERSGLQEFTPDNGWLLGTGRHLRTQTRVQAPDGEGETTYPPAEWANFDIKAIGVSSNEEGDEADYWVRIFREVGPVDVILPGRVLGDGGRLNTWLAALRVSIIPPDNIYPRSGSQGVRLQRYLEFQKPPHTRITRVLGWDAKILDGRGGFVTHDGILTGTESLEFADAGVRPDPALQVSGKAAHHYGFTQSKKEARRVLREVLTFQDETACSVFGAWWAACFFKPQIHKKNALFPFMAIEAPSESGKTNGFFDMMIQMNGSTRGETVPTFAALRDIASAHSNGIVWIDDLDDPKHLGELLRASTSNGTITKLGGDGWKDTNDSKIVAPVVLSGEALGLEKQKALSDRSVALAVTSPVGRMSQHNPESPQWDDVLALRTQYPNGLSAIAGWLVQIALAQEEQTMAALQRARSVVGKGRNADKNAILLAGACLLDSLVATGPSEVEAAWAGKGLHYGRVKKWVLGQQAAYDDAENALTLDILPWALRHFGFPAAPQWRERGESDPAYVEGMIDVDLALLQGTATIRFNVDLLAAAWSREHHGRVESRVHSAEALQKQVAAVRTAPSGNVRMIGTEGKAVVLKYAVIGGEVGVRVLRRAKGQ